MVLQVDSLDKIIKNAIKVMEDSKYDIFEISEGARSEWESMSQELHEVLHDVGRTIEQVDRLEQEYRKARIRLTEVSRDFQRFTERDIKIAYEKATELQLQVTLQREKENHLRARRDELQKRLRNLERTIERAESLVSRMSVVLEYLTGDLHQVSQIIESTKNKQQLGLRVILAQEDERKRVAREIHDGLAQSMANVVLRSEIVERMMAKEDFSAAREEIRDLKSQVRGGLEEVRKIIFNLRPMALDDLGLVPALRKFVQDFEDRTRIRTSFDFSGKERRLESAMEVALFRMVQECFSNILKHANASYASLEMTLHPDGIKLAVQDNGVGFSLEEAQSRLNRGVHFGIMGMRERLQLLEGKLHIQSEPGGGTRITISIPFNTHKEE